MDQQNLPTFDDKKNKVIVVRADSYNSLSPIRVLQPNEAVENIGNKFTLSSATLATPKAQPKVCIIGNTIIRKVCDACTNNQPSCSSHTCFSKSVVDAGPKRRFPNILKKRSAVKILPKITADNLQKYIYERNLIVKSSSNNNKNLSLGSTIPLNALYSSKSARPNVEINNETYDEATVMDLLNKQCGDILETQLSSEMKQTNPTQIASYLEIKNNNQIGCNSEVSTDLHHQLNGTLVNEVSVETALTALMDKSDENYQLFTAKEVKRVPEKIFESPQRSSHQELNETVSDTSLRDSTEYTLNVTQVINNETKDLKKINTTISEGSLERLGTNNITGDNAGHYLVGSLFSSVKIPNENTNGSLHCLAKDTLEVGSTEQQELIVQNSCETNISEKSNKNETANLTFESPIISSKLKVLRKQKIWEIKPQDINFDIITSAITSPKFQEISLSNQPAQNNLLATGLSDDTNSEEIKKNIHENLNKYFGDLLKIIPKESLEVDNPSLNKMSEERTGTDDLISSEGIDSTRDTNDVISSDNAVNTASQDFIGATSATSNSAISRESSSIRVASSFAEPVETNYSADVENASSKFAPTEVGAINSCLKEAGTDPFVAEGHIDINNCDILVLKENGILEPLNIGRNINVPSLINNHNVTEKVTQECKTQETLPTLELENVEKINDCIIENYSNVGLGNVGAAENLIEPKLSKEPESEDIRLCENNENENTNCTVELCPIPSNPCSVGGDKNISTVDLQIVNSLAHVIEVPSKSNSGSDAETPNKYKAMTESERLELRNRIMEGKISKEEVFERIESQNIIQYNIIAEPLIEDSKWNQQKRDAKYLGECLKKQIEVMKKTYEYFENIIESALKSLGGNLTEGSLKNILNNLHFVKTIVDKTFGFYDIERWKQNKVRYKVINITRKDVKNGGRNRPLAHNGNGKVKNTKKSSNKLITKTLYRMNRLLEQLEARNNLLCKRKQNKFVAKLKEIARKDLHNSFTVKPKEVSVNANEEKKYEEQISTVIEKQTNATPVHSDDAQEDSHTYAGNTEKTNKDGIEKTQKESKNTIDVNKPVITPLSEGVKRILSQIEQLNKYRFIWNLRETTNDIPSENETGVTKLKNRIIMQKTASISKDEKEGSARLSITNVAEEGDLNKENEADPSQKKIGSDKKKAKKVTGDACTPRYSQRSRKPPDFYSADKYSGFVPKGAKTTGPKFVLDCSFLPQKSSKFTKYDNLEFELKNDDKPCVVLYDKTDKPKMSIFKADSQNAEKKATKDENMESGQTVKSKTKALSEKNSHDSTKRVLHKRRIKYEAVKRELRSTSVNQKNGIRK